MKPKSILSAMGVLCLLTVLILPLQVQASEYGESTTMIRTKVPDTHTVLLEIGEHGAVVLEGKRYTSKDSQAEIARLSKQTYIIQPDQDWQVETVRYGQKDAQETVKLSDNSFTASSINSDDNKLTVTFKKTSEGGGNTNTSGGSSAAGKTEAVGAKTGDTTNITAFVAALFLSVGAMIALIKKRREL